MTPHHHQSAPLLTAAEEIALARRVKAGGPDGLEARNELVSRNKGLVMKMAARRATRNAPIQDLIQEGYLGLMRAADDYDPDKHGTRFCTYASHWVFRGVIQARRGGRLVRLPDYTWQLLRRDFADLRLSQRSSVTSAMCSAAVCSLDVAAATAAPHEDTPDPDDPGIGPLMAALAGLPEPYRGVLRRRMARETLGAIGSTMGVGKERVRQIQADAMHLLRRALGVESRDPRLVRMAKRRRMHEIERARGAKR